MGDTWVGQALPDANHGTEVIMSVGDAEHSYLRFDLSSLPPNAAVTAATLTLCRTNGSGGSRTHELRTVQSNWTETSLTWNTLPAVSAVASNTITVPSSAGCTNANVTVEVQAWTLAAPNFGWRIVDVVEPGAPHVEYGTREGGVADRPVLSVTYTP
jgi:hypothetical protein